jgi:hypothetical protein
LLHAGCRRSARRHERHTPHAVVKVVDIRQAPATIRVDIDELRCADPIQR